MKRAGVCSAVGPRFDQTCTRVRFHEVLRMAVGSDGGPQVQYVRKYQFVPWQELIALRARSYSAAFADLVAVRSLP